MNDSQIQNRSFSRVLAWLLVVVLVAEAAGTSAYVPQFTQLFRELGGELPFLTTAVLTGAWLIWALPVIAISIMVSASINEKKKLPLVSVLLLLGLLWVPVAIYGLYLPVWEMAEVNGS